MEELNEVQKLSILIKEKLAEVMEENNLLEPGARVTDFFVAIVMADSMLFDDLTGEDSDVFDTLGRNTRLVFQYMKKNGKEESEEA